MGASHRKGKFIFGLLLLISLISSPSYDGFFVKSSSPSNEHQFEELLPRCESNKNSEPPFPQAQIDRLEQLVRNLSDLVAKLESRIDGSSSIGSLENTHKIAVGKEQVVIQEEGFEKAKVFSLEQGKEIRFKTGPVTKYSPFWSEKFQFMSAVNLDSIATSVNVLPFRDFEGFSKYIAVGDDKGRVYVFLRNGDVLVEFATLCEFPVTSMLSYMSAYMNESMLVTGHSNGVILVHKLWESFVGEDLSSLHMDNLVPFDSVELEPKRSPISILEVHNVGRSKYILSVDEGGKIKVFRENGTLYGLAVPTSRPLAFLKQRLLFLMERGAGSLDLRTMKIRETDCEGLNDSVVKNYVFDAAERSKAYGFTSSSDLIHVLLLGDIMNFKCRVRSRKKFEMGEPLAFQVIKGYLLITSQEKIYVYNVSTQHYIRSGAPRHTFSSDIEEIKSSFLPNQGNNNEGSKLEKAVIPLIASDREQLVILGLGGGCVGMYRSKLPVFKPDSNTMLWTSPVLFFILFLFGAWQFFAKKKEALTSWGPDDPFNSTNPVSSGPSPPLGPPPPGERSRNADIMDLRSNGLRGPSRRYTSPSRYPGGTGNTFRPSSVDPTSRPQGSMDPNYRAASELKFRGQNMDSNTGFRRENMFGNTQVVDDGN